MKENFGFIRLFHAGFKFKGGKVRLVGVTFFVKKDSPLTYSGVEQNWEWRRLEETSRKNTPMASTPSVGKLSECQRQQEGEFDCWYWTGGLEEHLVHSPAFAKYHPKVPGGDTMDINWAPRPL